MFSQETMETPTQVKVEDITILGIATIETIIHITIMILKGNLKNIKKVVARKVVVEVEDNKEYSFESTFFWY